MSATYNLKNTQDYQDFYDLVVSSIKEDNEFVDGFPVDDCGEEITTDYLWEEFGHMLDGRQSGLGQQVFDEVIESFRN